MLITIDELAEYTGVVKDFTGTTGSLYETFIKAAQAQIINYLGYDPETINEPEVQIALAKVYGEVFTLDQYAMADIKNTCLEIAALIAMESGNNLGVNTSSELGVSRSYLNVVDYTKYLSHLSAYRLNCGVV